MTPMHSNNVDLTGSINKDKLLVLYNLIYIMLLLLVLVFRFGVPFVKK